MSLWSLTKNKTHRVFRDRSKAGRKLWDPEKATDSRMHRKDGGWVFTQVLSALSFQCPPGQQGALDLTDGFLQPGQAMGDITHTHTRSFRSQALLNPSKGPHCPFTRMPGGQELPSKCPHPHLRALRITAPEQKGLRACSDQSPDTDTSFKCPPSSKWQGGATVNITENPMFIV